MSMHSTPSPTASALNIDSPVLLQPDPDPRTTSSPMDSMPSDDKRQSISYEAAESGTSETRILKASFTGGSKSVDGNGGRPVEDAPLVSSNTKQAVPSPTNTVAASNKYTAHIGGQQDERDNTLVVAAPVLPSDTETAPPGTTKTTPTPSQRAQNMTGQDKQDITARTASDGRPHRIVTETPRPSTADGTPQDGWKDLVDIQRQILDVLTKMSKKMDGEEDDAPPTGGGAGAQPHKDPFKQTRFGIPKQNFDRGQQFNPMNEDYEAIFPEDPYGEEAGPNARVFRVYNEEAAVYDADMIGQCSDSSDVLLVFAGLFSAVLTTFVAQTSQALDQDSGAISNSLLSEVVHLLRAQEDGTSFGDVAPAITETTPTGNDLWVNGLWFTSLTLSLSTALFAVLTKQWLRQFMRKTSGTARDRSLIRQFRFAGMEKWHVVTIIGILPILLHLALGVFLVGLIVFLFPRSLPLACVVMSITVLIYFLYFVSNLLPVLDIQCPYRTPFSDILNILCHLHLLIRNRLIVLLKFICKHLHRVWPFIPQYLYFHYKYEFRLKLLGTQELDQVQSQSGSLSLNVIEWLTSTSSNPSVLTVGVEAIGGLPPSQREDILKTEELPGREIVCDLIKNCLKFPDPQKGPSCRPGYIRKLERLCRTFPLLRRTAWFQQYLPWDIYPIFHDLKDVRGMVVALGVYPNEREDHSAILTHLFDSSKSPQVTLSPSAWVNLFKNLGNVEPVHRLEICKQVLESGNPASDIQAWKDLTEPVPMSYVLNEGPEGQALVLSAFRNHDPFQNLDSISQPPDSPHLHALLVMYYFLESQTISESSVDIVSLLCSVWRHIHYELNKSPTVHDCTVVFHTTSLCLLQSGLLKGNEWMLSKKRSNYCYAVLNACDDALIYVRSAPPDIQWNCGEQITEIAFTTGDVPSEDYITSTHKMAGILWGRALDRDIEGAYTSFIKFHVLRHQPPAFKRFDWLILNFISGLARQLGCPSPHPARLMRCKSYLHHPDNLLMACKILVEHGYSNSIYDELVHFDPDNEAWEGCWEKLRQWCPDNNNRLTDFKDSLDALEKFFKERRRRKERFNPAFYFRSVFGRHRNTSAPSLSTDVEMGPLSMSQTADSERATSQEIHNPVVPVIELDGEAGDSGQPPNEEDIERSSSRGSEIGISPAQEESSSSYHTARVLLSDISKDEDNRETLRRGTGGLVQENGNDNARKL